MELVTVMHNVLMMLNLLTAKPILMDGNHLQLTQTLVLVKLVLVVLKWTFGKPIPSLVHTLHIHAQWMDKKLALAKTVETILQEKDIKESVIKMVAI